MEEARYWMWRKRKHDIGNRVKPSYGDSWEEQAFAEDAAGTLGGCVWPPRSYSCSFCRREFKSAQALGGHMNVHRRDRARLKQSPPSPQICTFLYNPISSDSDQLFLATPPSPIRVSAEDEPFLPLPPPQSHIFPSVIHEKRKSNTSSPKSNWSNLVLRNEDKSSPPAAESNCRAKLGEYVKPDLSVSLNLLVCRTHTNLSDHQSCKRRRINELDATSRTLLLPRSSPHAEVLNMSPDSIEDLDLELRLGDPPKVK